MKKESISTFNEGLVYDLNPITTPNNVLTDCVNGTFLTFNGDELALQNDAGNTTISVSYSGAELYDEEGDYEIDDIVYITEDGVNKYYKNLTGTNDGTLNTTDWQELIVRLSEDFYPIGIKEYGGILYIVSAKQPTIVPFAYPDGQPYSLGDVIYQSITGINYYYESLVDDNNDVPDLVSTESWLLVGIKKDFINKYGFIEFGSYPSPEIIDADFLDTSIDYSIVNTEEILPEAFKEDLYNPKIINNSTFRAGVYVSFSSNENTLNDQNITFKAYSYDIATNTLVNESTYRNIYKIRLLHQLTNGFIDLTDDIWEKYAIYHKLKTGANLNINGIEQPIYYWFSDPEFKYYCPHNFKGKLIISTELEKLNLFTGDIPNITLDESDDFLITFHINYENDTMWNQLMVPNTIRLYYTLDGTEPDYINFPVNTIETSAILDPDFEFTLTLPKSKIGILTYSGSTLNDASLSGTYQENSIQTIWIKISTASTTDKIDISFDGGLNWDLTDIELTENPIPLGSSGVLVTFNAITGHTLNDYWETILIPGYENKTLRYKILPDFYHNSNLISWEDFPQRFLDEHTINGSIIIIPSTADITVTIDDYYSYCESDGGDWRTGYKIIERILLINSDEENVDNLGEPSADKRYYFFLQGSSIPDILYDEYPVAEYTIDYNTGRAVVDVNSYTAPGYYPPDEDLLSYLQNKVENTYVRYWDDSCLYITLYVFVNKDFGKSNPIKIVQEGQLIYGTRETPTLISFLIKPDTAFTIKPHGLWTVDDYYYEHVGLSSSNEEDPISFAVVTDIHIVQHGNIGGFREDRYHIDIEIDFFGDPIPDSEFTSICHYNSEDFPIHIPLEAQDSAIVFTYQNPAPPIILWPTYDIEFINLVTTSDYVNLIGQDIFISEFDNNIFKPTYHLSHV